MQVQVGHGLVKPTSIGQASGSCWCAGSSCSTAAGSAGGRTGGVSNLLCSAARFERTASDPAWHFLEGWLQQHSSLCVGGIALEALPRFVHATWLAMRVKTHLTLTSAGLKLGWLGGAH